MANWQFCRKQDFGNVVPIADDRLENLKISVMVGEAIHSEQDNVLSQFRDFRTMFSLHKGEYLPANNELGNPWRTPLASDRPADLDD
jgi:hypothetical protein